MSSSLLSLPLRLKGELGRLADVLLPDVLLPDVLLDELLLVVEEPPLLNGEEGRLLLDELSPLLPNGLLPGKRLVELDELLSLSLPRVNGDDGRLPVDDELLPPVLLPPVLLVRLNGDVGRLPADDELPPKADDPPGRKLLVEDDLSSLPLSRGSCLLPDV